MYVVGANLLGDFWGAHREAEGELRALHALLTATAVEALPAALRAIATFGPGGAEVKLRTATVRLEISAAAGVARYAAVTPAGEEQE
jgi:hypothetical protein